MSFQGAHGSPERAPKELLRNFLGGNMESGEAQKSFPQAPESLENDLKIKMFMKHCNSERKPSIFQAPKASWELRFASKKFKR